MILECSSSGLKQSWLHTGVLLEYQLDMSDESVLLTTYNGNQHIAIYLKVVVLDKV